MNDPKLKLEMAKLLPHLVQSTVAHDGEYVFRWIAHASDEYNHWLKETEWLYVMHLVEQTLGDKAYLYIAELEEVCGVKEESLTVIVDWALATATFNQRATAMCKVKGITT